MIEEPKKLTVRRDFPRPTPAQIEAFRDVPTSFVCDAMGGGGSLSPAIRSLGDGTDLPCTLVGPAITAVNGPADILATLAALHFVRSGDVLVVAFAGHQGCAAVGDRLTGMLKNSGGAGLVTDGPVRDRAGLVAVGLPIFSTGLNPASPHCTGPGTVGLPAQIGGQTVASGDMIVADRDGVVVVPHDRIDAVIARLETVRQLETELDAEVAEGLKIPQGILDFLDGDETAYIDG